MGNIVLYICLIAFLMIACSEEEKQAGKEREIEQQDISDNRIKKVSRHFLKAVKNNDFEAIAGMIHPEKGTRFSPYAYVDTSKHVRLMPDEFREAYGSDEVFTWGTYDGVGGPIELTLNEYFKEFVYDRDFLNAPKVSIEESIASGNMINNIEDIYPRAKYIEYYFPGERRQFKGLDWRALRLVFDEYKGEPKLIALIHSQWTI